MGIVPGVESGYVDPARANIHALVGKTRVAIDLSSLAPREEGGLRVG